MCQGLGWITCLCLIPLSYTTLEVAVNFYYDGEVRIIKVSAMSPSDNNGYVLMCPETNDAVVIDAPGEYEKLVSQIPDTVSVKRLLITHGHRDHIASYEKMRAVTGQMAGIHELDEINLSPLRADFYLSAGDTINVGTINLKVLHTPGHTGGAVCLLVGKHLFSGDTLFPGGPGYTRTPDNFNQIINSITNQLFELPSDTKVYPGHGGDTDIGNCRKEYAVFAGKTRSDDIFGEIQWLNS